MVQQKLVSSEKTNEKEKICRDEPELRFPEFNEKWETLKLGDFLEFISTNSLSRAKLNLDDGKIKNIHYGDIHTKFPTIVNVENEEIPFINLDEDTSKFKKEQFCKEGDLVIADASEDYADIGKAIELVNVNIDLVAGLHTILARDKSNKTATGFKGYLFLTEDLRKKIKINANGISVLGISKNNIANLDVKLPSKQEQEKISSFLHAIDKKIELLEKKLVLYQQLEKDIRKSIFNFNNEKVRFNKFLLGEIAEIKKGFTPSTQNEEFWDDGKYLWLSIADMNKKYLTETSKKITEKAIKNKEIVPKNTLVMSFKLTIGKLAILKEDMFTNEAIASFNWKNKKISTEYMYFYLKSINIKKYGSQAAKGITLNNETLNSIPVYLPDSNKQKEIVEILLSFNNKIDLVKTQLTALNRFKKGLLQKMFI